MVAMTPSIVTPRSCKRFSISELTYSPCLTIAGFCAGIGLLPRRIFHKRTQGPPLRQGTREVSSLNCPCGLLPAHLFINRMKNSLVRQLGEDMQRSGLLY